jgi:hypothetical protein
MPLKVLAFSVNDNGKPIYLLIKQLQETKLDVAFFLETNMKPHDVLYFKLTFLSEWPPGGVWTSFAVKKDIPYTYIDLHSGHAKAQISIINI